MSRLIAFLMRFNDRLEARVDRIVQPARWKGPHVISAFCGYGAPEKVSVQGRVLRSGGLGVSTERDSRLRNFLAVARRFNSREVSGATVRGTLGGAVASTLTDDEGYFTLEFRPEAPLTPGWHDAVLELPGRDATATAPVRIVDGADFGVISDLDDTVVVTGATKLWQMLATVLFANAHTRLPFPGVSALYRHLTGGPRGGADNPVFYVSSSPWNLFDVIWTFLEYRRIPLGPVFLRDWNLGILRSQHGGHKLEAIGKLFTTFPDLSFVLVGDSGEQDPEIYREVVARFPDRVLAVYIREVTGARRREKVMRLREELRAHRLDLVLARDSLAAAHHA
ncbi:App1 family protein, partial [Deinococcus pimensis]|uniref:App1 family protein n=1 Tax=Deinococcus pimensis TaxID=309888 RepID=UPI000694193E